MKQAVALEQSARGTTEDVEYRQFLDRLYGRFLKNVGAGVPLFTTSATDLFDIYLSRFSEEDRQHHNCNACRHFINRFGGLVTIREDGVMVPAFWSIHDAPPIYQPSILAMVDNVMLSTVTGVFLSSDPVWGTPVTGDWQHLSVTPPPAMVFRNALHTAGQVMAEKREDYKNVCRALGEFKKPVIDQALNILNAEALYRSEKVIGPANWLSDLHAARDKSAHKTRRDNVTWLAIATAPAGFCHPRSSMIGTLLEDIAAGMAFEDVSKRFAAKMHPLSYQRPQTPPSAGNIAQAEKIMATLGAAGSLARRYARLDEIVPVWFPEAAKPAQANGPVFGHLTPKEGSTVRPMSLPMVLMTWEKFARTVLPTAASIKIQTPPQGNYAAIVTAADFDAPPIIQWDQVSQRNPFSWYGYSHGSRASQWSLSPNELVDVTGICLQPSQWYGHYPQHGEGVHFIMAGAKDTRNGSGTLFPELMKNEFHPIRKTIEAYSASATLGGKDQESASGYKITKSAKFQIDVRVTGTDGNTSTYRIDRWD